MWQQSIAHNIRSREAAQRVDNAKAEAHALTYMLYAHMQQGADEQALVQLKGVRNLAKEIPLSDGVANHLAGAEAIYILERQAWLEATNIKLPSTVGESAVRAHAYVGGVRALSAARAHDISWAKQEIADLKKLNENPLAWSPDRVAIWIAVSSAWLSQAEGRQAEALEHMARAVEFEQSSMFVGSLSSTSDVLIHVEEQRGDLLLELARYKEALAAYELSLAASPSHLNSLYGAGRAAELAGSNQLARQYYSELLELAAGDETNRAEFAHAQSVLRDSS
jgi:tetratricopeptide (TPR) repeat protein